MFFLSNTNEAKSYTLIHNVFFEQIMPYLDDKYLKVYMYTYYLANNIDKIGVKNNEDIAKDLNIDYLDVISAFDYLEKFNLIRKHYVENSQSDNYSIEILPLNKYSKKQETTYEMEYISSKNEKLRQMYDKIEE
ncbi:MAG: DnaD domain protein, partial [Peptoanaerobacter stomatis]